MLPITLDHPAPRAWHRLAIVALGIGALCALTLVAARTPFVAAALHADAFSRALVLHVDLVTLVWLLAMSAALWQSGAPHASPRTAAWAGACALSGVAIGLAGGGTPVLADYLPYLTHPAYGTALAGFVVAVLVVAASCRHRPVDTRGWALLWMRLPIALAALEAAVRLGSGDTPRAALWGAGHQLQIAWTMLLMGLWLPAGQTIPRMRSVLAATALLALVAPLVSLRHPELVDTTHGAVMRFALGPALVLGALMTRPWRQGGAARLSFVLCASGLLIGPLIGTQTTTIPAHYHGVVGALSVCLFAIALPRARAALWCHGIGLLVMMAGLLAGGVAGLARKLPLDMASADMPVLMASTLIGIGGTLAALGALVGCGQSQIWPTRWHTRRLARWHARA